MNQLAGVIADHIRANGPIPFDEFVSHALYTPELGFYAGGGGAGRRRDFLTSPEVGPIFATVVGRALDEIWVAAGEPSHLTLVEAGAGPGTLARGLLASQPRCHEALRTVLVEPARTQWASHPAEALTRAVMPEAGEFNDGPVVVLANELIDNLPFGLVELTAAGWCEVFVGVDEQVRPAGQAGQDARAGGAPTFTEMFLPLPEVRAAWCTGRAGRDAPLGTRLPVQADAAVWLADALDLVAAAPAGGRVILLDYATHTREMAARPWRSWVRTYAAHGQAGHPLEDPGTCDITVEVAYDQLATVAEPTLNDTQANWLRSHGIEELVEEGRQRWHQLGMAGGLEAVAARSRVHEAEALLDEGGLGAFRVLEWASS